MPRLFDPRPVAMLRLFSAMVLPWPLAMLLPPPTVNTSGNPVVCQEARNTVCWHAFRTGSPLTKPELPVAMTSRTSRARVQLPFVLAAFIRFPCGVALALALMGKDARCGDEQER